MRNIFDQYSQPENRITHAFVTALNEDRALLRSFLKEVVNLPSLKRNAFVEIIEQSYPGSLETSEEEAERRGIPDAWITAGSDWCLVIESKVLMAAKGEQIARHLSTAKRLGYSNPMALLITVDAPNDKLPDGTNVVEWRGVYGWLVKKSIESPWAKRVATYLEVIEGRMIDQKQFTEGTLTIFNGFPFGHENPFSYVEAKRVLKLSIDDLKSRKDLISDARVDPDLPSRPAITGTHGDSVWDFLQVDAAKNAKSFTEFPHFTLGVNRAGVEAMLTIPNSMKPACRKRLVELGIKGFKETVHQSLKHMATILENCEGMEPRIVAVQRRYKTQRSVPFRDAIIDFDLRTGYDDKGPLSDIRPPKTQPEWINAVYECFDNRNSNFQIQIGGRFPYRTCSAINSVEALNCIAATWIACRPLLEVMVPPPNS